MEEVYHKQCGKCGDRKPHWEFSLRAANTDGLDAWCKVCHREYGRQWYAANRKVHLARCHDYSRTAAGQTTRQRSRTKHISQIRANTYLNNAIKDGRFKRGTVCVDCSRETFVEGHHSDYTQPLNVEWLCPTCHKRRHRKQ